MDATVQAATPAAVQPLVWWSDGALADCAARVQRAWDAWCADWGLAAALVRAHNAVDAAPRDDALAWRPLAQGSAAWLAFTAPEAAADAAHAVGAWLFGTAAMRARPRASIAAEAAAKALARLHEALAPAVAGDVAAAPASPPDAGPRPTDVRPWSGAVRVRLPVGDERHEARLHLSPEAAARLLREPPRRDRAASIVRAPLVPLDQAAGALPVRLHVALEPFDLDLLSLQTLHPGDVVPLTHALDEPLAVQRVRDDGAPAEAEPLCAGALGTRAGRRAVQLWRRPPASR